MAYEIQEQDAQIGSGEQGIYTLTASDMETVHDIEKMKNLFLMNVDTMGKRTSINQLSSLLSGMQILMEKYDKIEFLENTKIDGYDFYYVKETIYLTEGNPIVLRRACEIAFTIWEMVLKQLGFGVPTATFRS